MPSMETSSTSAGLGEHSGRRWRSRGRLVGVVGVGHGGLLGAGRVDPVPHARNAGPGARPSAGRGYLTGRTGTAPPPTRDGPFPRSSSVARTRCAPSVRRRRTSPSRPRRSVMQVDELLKPFPIKEFHPFPRALMGPGAHEMIGPEALKLGFKKTLVMTSGLRGTDIVHKIVESMKYHGLEVVVYDKVESNPKDYNVMDAVGALPGERVRLVRLHRRRLLARRLQGRPGLGRARRPQRQRVRGLQHVREPEEPAAHRGVHDGRHRLGDLVGLRHHRHHDRPRQPAQVRRLRRRLGDQPGHRRPGALLRLPDRLHRPVRVRRARPRQRALRLPAELPAVARQRAARDQADQRAPPRRRCGTARTSRDARA